MLKACMNGSCRRVFDTKLLTEKKCPYCGNRVFIRDDAYEPHMPAYRLRHMVILESYDKERHQLVRFLVKELTGLNIDAVKSGSLTLPLTLIEVASHSDACHLCERLDRAGCRTAIKTGRSRPV